VKRRFLTVKETAEFLNLSADYIYQLTGQKKIPHVRIGRKVLFDVDKLEKFIDENTVEAIDWADKIQDWKI
jgi:excisionase family DNA binding protein